MENEETELNKITFDFPEDKIKLTLIHKKLELHLRSSFNTSHSSTTIRNNSLIIIKIEGQYNLYGLGESGIPPKKKGCYLADINDIKNFINDYSIHLKNVIEKKEEISEDNFPIKNLPKFIYILIHALDTCPSNKELYYNCAKNCIEGAIFDLCGKIKKKSLVSLINNIDNTNNLPNKYAFYTVTIVEEEEFIKALYFGLKYTQYIKVKLNKNYNHSKRALEILNNECNKIPNYKGKWSIDLNSDYSNPEEALKFIIEIVLKYKEKIYMIEQPFPINIIEQNEEEIKKWEKIKEKCEENNILIFADESISTEESINPLKKIISGINIKLEKCGGIRGALKCIKKAKELNLTIWIGCMVGSTLLMNLASSIIPFSIYSDLDGGLLVDDVSNPFSGGFVWDVNKGIILSNDYGTGVNVKEGFLKDYII